MAPLLLLGGPRRAGPEDRAVASPAFARVLPFCSHQRVGARASARQKWDGGFRVLGILANEQGLLPLERATHLGTAAVVDKCPHRGLQLRGRTAW